MKLIINNYNDKEIAKLILIVNELTGEKKVFKGWLKPSNDGSYKSCELTLDRTVNEFGEYVKPVEESRKYVKE